MHKLALYFATIAILLASCAPNADSLSEAAPDQTLLPTATENTDPAYAAEPTLMTDSSTAVVREEPDLSMLPIGTGNFSNGPQAGYLWSCQTQFAGTGGAQATGDWYNESAGIWNLNLKPTVDGAIEWDSVISITVQGDTRIIDANGLPASPTGNYPISSSDDAYQFDSNPNSISSQSYHLELPANPTKNATPQCVRGEVGISIDGVVINNALDALGRDAVATELQDACDGHPHNGGVYHYHGYSPCLEDQDAHGQSALIGYALDGFGIYGLYDENGHVLTSADLDECHGRTSLIEWDGEMVEMYHYVATYDYPYTVGCYWGSPVIFTDALTGNNASQENTDAGGNTGGGQSGPPQEAINACSGLSQGAACSIDAPNGTINGTCADIQGQLACVP